MVTSVRSDERFDYQATAELFPGKNHRVRSRVLKYMRFAHAADAIRFAIENQMQRYAKGDEFVLPMTAHVVSVAKN